VTEHQAGTVKELGHVVLYVRNAQRSADFYRGVLGWPQIFPPAGQPVEAVAMFSTARTHHELLIIQVGEEATPVPAGRRLGLYHFGIKVGETDDELRAALTRLQEAGTHIAGTVDHGMTHSVYIEDPDGNEIELYIDVPGVDWNDPDAMFQTPRPLSL
jgi:catechol 2,3-dioxygenase